MAVAFRSQTSGGTTSGTSFAASAPAGLANDDILIMCLYKESTAAVTWPSGFTQVAAITASDSSFVLYAAIKRAASESGTYAVSWTGSAFYDWILSAYSGATTTGDGTDATTTTSANGSQNSLITCPSITTASANAMLIALGGQFSGGTLSAPSGMTLRLQNDDIGWADVIQTSAGASGTKSFTFTPNANSQTCGITIALQPAGAGGATLPLLNATYRII